MAERRSHNLMLLMTLLLAPSVCHGQTYQGPSGGRGGNAFDHWKATGGGTDISSVSVLQDKEIRCISVTYRTAPTSANAPLQVKNGFCEPGPGNLDFYGWKGIGLDADEYIVGIAGRHGDRIDSLRFYTNKKNSPVYGGGGGTVDFGYTAPQGQMIVAFFGRAGASLDAIGVMYAPCPSQKKGCR